MLTAEQIAAMVNARIHGDPGTIISGVSSFDDAGPNDLTFAVDHSFFSRLDETKAGMILVSNDAPEVSGITLLYTANPKLAFFKVVEHLMPEEPLEEFIHPSAVIADDCIIGQGTRIDAHVSIGPGCTIGSHVHIMANTVIGKQCRINDSCRISSNVTLVDKTQIGKQSIIHPNCVIGSDGFGFVQDGYAHAKLVHTGYVQIGDCCEIGACNTIDRGTLGITRIGNGVKTDNQVHIAHNVKIGDNTLVVAQVGIAGSTTIGKNVIIAGKAGISGHLKIGDGAIVGPYAGVSANVSPGDIVSGVPHMSHKIWLKVSRIIPRLPSLRTRLLSLEKRLKKLESNRTEQP
ncbi:UDP-3-O-(3-hydroxymyristoyl)glucosamine N-acyltransferase [uncultured Desulfobacter sp.]|uniref:UDP-3-O-(3-hydroxymyristoyl)glucosamine N-acyltransferase n=1 Tax=uncultured Desulfobacter sp. TaxID=240139 RepID=UPI0029F57A80|nr:UDP-3-O-(3-hydroxymyristoyl)glucosamine N-acyltransferase [uncultured Desulfobacter sp.]